MSLRKAKGNMYSWLTHTWSPMGGCSHQCSYCYVTKYKALPEVPVLNKDDFPPLGEGRRIFVGHMCDMFCEAASEDDIFKVLSYCHKYPKNEYVFQTKNVKKMVKFIGVMPRYRMVGTTIETNRKATTAEVSKAPPPSERAKFFRDINELKFITIEPILDFDRSEFLKMIVDCKPLFINIGADSKKHNLKEPSGNKLKTFIADLQEAGVCIHKKVNLDRLLGGM